jgi:hypothetical protein
MQHLLMGSNKFLTKDLNQAFKLQAAKAAARSPARRKKNPMKTLSPPAEHCRNR